MENGAPEQGAQVEVTAAKNEVRNTFDLATNENVQGNSTVEQAAQYEARKVADATNARLLSQQIKNEMGGPEGVNSVGIAENPTFKRLRTAFNERNLPGNFNQVADEDVKALSAELLPQMQTAADFKEASFFLASRERGIADTRWDELSMEEIQNAKTPEEIESALDNCRIGYVSTLSSEAKEKYFNLTGKDLGTVRRVKALDEAGR